MSYEERESEVIYDSDVNGFLLSNIFFPEELIINILSFVPWKDLQSCRLVCCRWKNLIDSLVCFVKLRSGGRDSINKKFGCPAEKLNIKSIPFYLYYAVGRNRFNINLLKNVFGSDDPQFKHWKVVESGGDGWIVEGVPVGSDPLPEELEGSSCFVTSYFRSHKKQCINLEKCGLNSKIMDEIQPLIEVSEWYAARFDCGIIYRIKISLLDKEKNPIIIFEDEIRIEQWLGRNWHKVSHTFKDYGPGIRYVLFEHGGNDTLGWAGHYGSKMAGASVVARIPYSMFTF